MTVNTDQADAWNGYEGEQWADNDDRWDAVHGAFNTPLLAAASIGPTDRVLDVGCGNGQLTRQAAELAARAQGIDLSTPMLAKARERAAHLDNITFTQGDAQVYPFPDGELDVALSRLGVAFFADPVAAFTNIARALRPGGRLAFLCMTALAGTDLGAVFGELSPYLPQPTGPDGTGPTSFADPEHTRAVLTAAGFADVLSTRVTAPEHWGADVADATAFFASWGPVRYHLGMLDADTAGKARDALSTALARFAGPDGVRLEGVAWLVTAHR